MIPKRGVPTQKISALGAGPVAPGPITLVDNFVAFTSVDQSSDVGDATQAPVTNSYGGNFTYYLQHKVTGIAGAYGFLAGSIRAQVWCDAIGNDKGPTNDPVVIYGGLYNGGKGTGGFGLHFDVYHAGEAVGRHSTYGISVEAWKNIMGGVCGGYVVRSQGKHPLEFGLVALNVGQGVGFKRLIWAGAPSYEQGGPVGSYGHLVPFDIGADFTWGAYRWGPIVLKGDDWQVWSGEPQGVDVPPPMHCRTRWNRQTGNWETRNGDAMRFGVNMSNGVLFLSAKALDPTGRLRVVVEDDEGKMRSGFVRIDWQ